MKTNRAILILLSLAVVLQAITLYKGLVGGRSKKETPRAAVVRAPIGTTLDTNGLPVKGSDGAKVALIVFSDYECPFCSKYEMGVGKDLDKEFVDTAKVRVFFVNNPLPIHSSARSLAAAAICAGNQGKYWEMHDRLFSDLPKGISEILDLSDKLPLDSKLFQECMDRSPETAQKIERDLQAGKKLKIMGTPTFGIGSIDSQGRVKIETFVSGAQSLAVFQEEINDVLTSKQPL